jgi:membrane-bound metal-dependent hydrolase YbcI (DUF457 family)
MSGKTHAMIGANAVWLAHLLGQVDASFPFLIAVGAFAALLPDIDAVYAKIHFVFKGIFGMFKHNFTHRGFFHSLVAVALLYLICFLFLRTYHPLLPPIIALGYASHPFIDAFNGGVQYLFPYPRFLSFVPRLFRFRVNSNGDHALFFLGALGIVYFFIIHKDIFVF